MYIGEWVLFGFNFNFIFVPNRMYKQFLPDRNAAHNTSQHITLTLSLETLVPSLIEELLHDRFLEVFRIVHLEMSLSLPRNNIGESTSFALFQHSMQLPWEGCLSVASYFRQKSWYLRCCSSHL